MKVLFVEAKRKNNNIDLDKIVKKVPKEVHMLYSIQYKELAEKIKEKLISKNFEVKKFEQVLGCSEIKPVANLLLIGSGCFHAIQLASRTQEEVFIYESGTIRKITKEEIEKTNKKQKAKLSKFYSSNNIGVLVSNKKGQKNIELAKKIKSKINKEFPDKKVYLFFTDNINEFEFENFSADIFVNTACPGLEYDSKKIINWDTIKK